MVSREAGIFCLTSAAGIANSSAGSTKIRSAPYNFPYAGGVWNSTLNLPGSSGYSWSRTVISANDACYLGFDSSGVGPSNGNARYVGFSVRCVATT